MQRRRLGAAVIAALFFLADPVLAQRADPIPQVAGPIIQAIETRHQVTVGGRSLAYRAVFQEFELKADDRPLATISATAYLRSDVGRSDNRPVFFFFNGGPGASSSPLHFSAFGPRLRPQARDATEPFVNNEHSPLDVADLVFIDPVSTGLSRVLLGGDGRPFWAPMGDANAVLSLIRRWLDEHRRNSSPIFIGGESYGSYRLATMMRKADDLNLHGLLMISPSTSTASMAGAAPNQIDRVFALPVMAVAAWYHQVIPRRAPTVEEQHAEALAFAESEYLVALHKGPDLPDAARGQVAKRMAELVGLPVEMIIEHQLRISDDVFVENLLRDRNLLIGRLDTRVTGPVRLPQRQGRPAAANDPALGLGRTNVIRSAAITRYMREELQVPADREYVSLTLDVNFNWNWFEKTEDRRLYHNPLGNVARVMEERPGIRLMVVGGIYDLATPTASARHALRHSGIPLGRVDFLTLPAGHSPFETAADRARFAEAVREFVRSAVAQP